MSSKINLFHAHDRHGIPLSISLMILKSQGRSGSVAQFFFTALKYGWDPDTALTTIEYALRDNEMEFDKEYFLKAAALLYNKHHTFDACIRELSNEPAGLPNLLGTAVPKTAHQVSQKAPSVRG